LPPSTRRSAPPATPTASRPPRRCARKRPSRRPAERLRDAQTEKAQWEARRSALDVSERLGKLVPVAEVETAMVRAGEAIVRAIEQLPTFAGEIMAASRDGEPALRRKLRDIKDQIRRRAADALTLQRNEGQADEEAGSEFDLGVD
jgi:hypothetical protein